MSRHNGLALPTQRRPGSGCSAPSPSNIPALENRSDILRQFSSVFSSNFDGLSTGEHSGRFVPLRVSLEDVRLPRNGPGLKADSAGSR